jgi:RHS repeat-associated protein
MAPPRRPPPLVCSDETDQLYYGYRYYSASVGRWLSRDPIGERGGLNRYGFVGNDSVDYLDRLGLVLYDESTRKILVEKCEIVILFGHGSETNHWNWKVASGCNAAAAVMCWPDANSQGIPPDKDLNPIKPDPDITIQWGDYSEAPGDSSKAEYSRIPLADKMFDTVYKNAVQRAQALCKQNCCAAIRVRFIWKPKPANSKLIENPLNSQTDYGGKLTIQDYVWNCNSPSKTLVPR